MLACLYEICGFDCAVGCPIQYCPRSQNLNRSMEMAGLLEIPRARLLQLRKLEVATVDKEPTQKLYSVLDNLRPFVNEGKSLYICSKNCGNGKTSWSIKLLLNYLMISTPSKVIVRDNTEPIGMMVRPHALMNDVKRSFSNPDPEINKFLSRLKAADLVVWDDLGCAKVSPYDQNILIDIIGYRELYGKANIFTSNLNTFEKLVESVGERLASRVWNGSTIVELRGSDRRGKQ